MYVSLFKGDFMLIDVEKMRKLRNNTPEMKFSLLKPNIERFFRDYIYYYDIYNRNELIIDSGYLPYHYLTPEVIEKLINLLENELGYNIIIMKTTNTNKLGYQKGDLINIRLFDRQNTTAKEIDDYFNLKMFQPLYSSFHNFNNIYGDRKIDSYLSCLSTGSLLIGDNRSATSGILDDKTN